MPRVLVAAFVVAGCTQPFDPALLGRPGSGRRTAFDERCARPEVVRCFGFDDAAELAPHMFLPQGVEELLGEVDPDVKASGEGSLRFTIPSFSGSDTSGSFWLDFSSFGEGDDLWVQWRQRFSPALLETRFEGSGGFTQAMIGAGDRAGVTAFTCTAMKVALSNVEQRGVPQMFFGCTGETGASEPLSVPAPGGDTFVQNAVRCPASDPTDPACARYVADEWMSFQVHVHVGTWHFEGAPPRHDSTIELWVGREGQPSRRVIARDDVDIPNDEPEARYGKVWLLPYQTNKDETQDHPTAYTWYDELVVSSAPISD